MWNIFVPIKERLQTIMSYTVVIIMPLLKNLIPNSLAVRLHGENPTLTAEINTMLLCTFKYEATLNTASVTL